MTLGILSIYIGIAAVLLSAAVYFTGRQKDLIVSYLQNFTGALFVFSGWVKAVDPLGTAYKMEQYFAEFEYTFEATWFSFLAPLFPVFSEYAIAFSVFMIVFEIVLGLMLLLGVWNRIGAWLFFLLVLFFTGLTGFTFLTGYVPGDANFFEFSKWTAYDPGQMKVTDCGCFGDFIKLEPKISFFKDLVLMIPAIIFLLRHSKMHVWLPQKWNPWVVGISALTIFLYCQSNYQWNLPSKDFRPFKIGAELAKQKKAENDALANVSITGWKLQHNESGEILELGNQTYLSEYEKYKDDWKVVDQIKSKPTIPITKVGEFEAYDHEGMDQSEALLSEEGYSCLGCLPQGLWDAWI